MNKTLWCIPLLSTPFLLPWSPQDPTEDPTPITGEVPDQGKRMVEQPIKDAFSMIELEGDQVEAFARRVAPGDVPWHASFEEAVAAAGESKKPVLLFQLLGRLDEEFC